jgi:hypothetical protein
MRSRFVIGTAAAFALFAAAAPVQAQEIAMPAGPWTGVPAAATPPVEHQLVATYFNQADANSTLPKKGPWTFNNGISITCATGCTVEFNAMVQVGNNKAASNQWEICGVVNGTLIADCPYQGTLPTNTDYVTGNYIGTITLAKSNKPYLLQPGVYVSAGPVEVALYAVTYRVYQP